MQLDKFMWLNIVPRYLTVFFQNLTSGEPEQCVCVSRNLRLLVLFMLAVGAKGGEIGLEFDFRDLVPLAFIIIFVSFTHTVLMIAARFTINHSKFNLNRTSRSDTRGCKRYRRRRSLIPSNILEPWVER